MYVSFLCSIISASSESSIERCFMINHTDEFVFSPPEQEGPMFCLFCLLITLPPLTEAATTEFIIQCPAMHSIWSSNTKYFSILIRKSNYEVLASWLLYHLLLFFFAFDMIINNNKSFIIARSPVVHLNAWLLRTEPPLTCCGRGTMDILTVDGHIALWKKQRVLQISFSFGAAHDMLFTIHRVCCEFKESKACNIQ